MGHTEEWIIMQKDLGLGHKGNIIVTTQRRIDENVPWIADCGCEVDAEANARLICAAPKLKKACNDTQELLRISFDNADSERYDRQDADDYDRGYSEGKLRAIETLISSIDKIVGPALADAGKE